MLVVYPHNFFFFHYLCLVEKNHLSEWFSNTKIFLFFLKAAACSCQIWSSGNFMGCWKIGNIPHWTTNIPFILRCSKPGLAGCCKAWISTTWYRRYPRATSWINNSCYWECRSIGSIRLRWFLYSSSIWASHSNARIELSCIIGESKLTSMTG